MPERLETAYGGAVALRLRALAPLPIAAALTVAAAVAHAQKDQKLPDAATAAKQVYQTVILEDVIKAVSKSKTHDGFYLSFGAPYPKQVLSVWASNETYHNLPGAGALVGRTVRIRGMVDPTATGPMIYLGSPAQFELRRVDEAMISKTELEGKGDRHQFIMAIRYRLQRNEFETIETLGSELHESHERFLDGTWMLDAFFGAFKLGPDRSNETFEQRARSIADWKARYPESILPILVDARFRIDLAWKWRAIEAGDKPPNECGQRCQQELAAARQILEANPQAKTSPNYFVEMMGVALGQGWQKEDYFHLFAEAISHEPDYDRFYSAAANYLRWYGKNGEWEAFAEEQRRKLGGPEGVARYTRIAWSQEDEYRHHLFNRTAISWPTMAAGFEALMQQYPTSNYLKNAYAYFAWEAEDRARLRPALEAIKAHPDMDIWVNLENVQFAQKFATDEFAGASSK